MQTRAMKKIFQSLQRTEAALSDEPGGGTRLARQPIFDKSGAINAYELLFRPIDRPYHGYCDIANPHVASASVMLDGFNLVRPTLAEGQRVFINFTGEMLEAEIPLLLPPETCVLEIAETARPSHGLLTSVAHLRRLGYACALDNYTGQLELQPFLPAVDIVKINALGMSTRKLFEVASGLRNQVALLASKVEDPVVETFCREFGFSLFQGNMYSGVEIVEGTNIRPAELTKNRLLTYIAKEDASLAELTEFVSADVHLTFKLLNFVNSVYYDSDFTVKTVAHAIMLLGRIKLKKWLFAITLADINSVPMPRNVACLSAQRARFLALLGEKSLQLPVGHSSVQQLFTLGLFSMLESDIHEFFVDITRFMGLDDAIVRAYRHNDGPLAPWLALLMAHERNDETALAELAQSLNLAHADIEEAHTTASSWGNAFYSDLPCAT